MRCPRCGNDNPDGNRFCGMCGAALLAAEVPATQTQRAASSSGSPSLSPAAPVRPRTTEPLRPAPPPPDDKPSISGPSFLGLNDPAPQKRDAGVSIDPRSSSRNLDYLLDDDEPPRGSGAGKIFLILIALALAVGFGYLRWKGHGLGWLSSGFNKPSAVAKNPDSSDSGSPAPANPGPESQTPPASSTATPVNPPAIGAAPTPNASSTPPAGNQSTSNPGSPAGNDATSSTTATPPGAAPARPAAKADNAAPAPSSDNGTADDNADNSASDDSGKTAADSPPPAETPAPKPRAAAKPLRTVDPVSEAQKYLYGRGVAQDCDRGLRLLKPAANASNPRAMVEMGALYSAGLCTPHDLPTAYRWFAMALRKDPGNQAIQTDLQKLWGEMTQPERQLAIKLTQ